MEDIRNFVKSLTGKTLDKISGTRTVYREGSEFYSLSSNTIKLIEELEEITGQTLYLIDKGFSYLQKYIKDLDNSRYSKIETTSDRLKNYELCVLEFIDFNIYFLRMKEFHYYISMILMNAKSVILPLKSDMKLSSERIFVVRGNDNYLYKFPRLSYPKAVKGLFEWLKKTKKINIKVIEIWDKNEDCGKWFESEKRYRIPKRNLVDDDSIKDYIDFLENEYLPKYQSKNKVVLLKSLIDINITQQDISEFVNLQNNRYKVNR